MVTYMANGGSGSMDPSSSLTALESQFTRQNYTQNDNLIKYKCRKGDLRQWVFKLIAKIIITTVLVY